MDTIRENCCFSFLLVPTLHFSLFKVSNQLTFCTSLCGLWIETLRVLQKNITAEHTLNVDLLQNQRFQIKNLYALNDCLNRLQYGDLVAHTVLLRTLTRPWPVPYFVSPYTWCYPVHFCSEYFLSLILCSGNLSTGPQGATSVILCLFSLLYQCVVCSLLSHCPFLALFPLVRSRFCLDWLICFWD